MAGMSSSPGCLRSLCDSVNRLWKSELLKADACHGTPLKPMLRDDFGLCKKYHLICKECNCYDALAPLLDVHGEAWNTEAFLRGKERFVISDDWVIKPASTTSLLSLAKSFGSDGIAHDFEEVLVRFSGKEVVSMLKASLSSDTVFTDAFLSKGNTDDHTVATVKPSIYNQTILPPSNNNKASSDSSPECKIRIFYNTDEKKVMYAECDHGFVDLLLGFLTCPLWRVIKNAGAAAGTCHLSRSLNNLYNSAVDLGATGLLIGRLTEETLLDPDLEPFPQVAEDRMYIVEDDLQIHPASAMSVMKHLRTRDGVKVNFERTDFTIGKHEVVMLMQAAFTSKMALTDVFKKRLEMMQIFVVYGGRTMVVNEVAGSHTIASVKSKLRELDLIPASCLGTLHYCSRILMDSHTVAEYNIVARSTVHLSLYGPPFVQKPLPR